MPGMSYAQDQAMKAADKRLKDAAIFASLNIKNPIFQRRIGKGYSAALVRLDWPGVLTVLDPETGKIWQCQNPADLMCCRANLFQETAPTTNAAASCAALKFRHSKGIKSN